MKDFCATLLLLLHIATCIAYSTVSSLYSCISREVNDNQECRVKACRDPQLNTVMETGGDTFPVISREQTLIKILTKRVDIFYNHNKQQQQ